LSEQLHFLHFTMLFLLFCVMLTEGLSLQSVGGKSFKDKISQSMGIGGAGNLYAAPRGSGPLIRGSVQDKAVEAEDAKRIEALHPERAEYEAMKKSDLLKLASTLGASQKDRDGALDADDPKAALIGIIRTLPSLALTGREDSPDDKTAAEISPRQLLRSVTPSQEDQEDATGATNFQIAQEDQSDDLEMRAQHREEATDCTSMHKAEAAGYCEGACTDHTSDIAIVVGLSNGTCQDYGYTFLEHDIAAGVYADPSVGNNANLAAHADANWVFEFANGKKPSQDICNPHHFIDGLTGVCEVFCVGAKTADENRISFAEWKHAEAGTCTEKEPAYSKYLGVKRMSIYADPTDPVTIATSHIH
jgi:hypothetical protein